MQSVRSSRISVARRPRRIPITITLDPRDLAFIDNCVSLKQFDSVDKLFEAALGLYRKHLNALAAYAEDQVHKGYSFKELLESIECETVVTRRVASRAARPSRAARRR